MRPNSKTNTDNIELRSEKVRHIIGKVPPVLVRTGTIIITLVVIAFGVAFYTIHYPLSDNYRSSRRSAAPLHT